VWRIPLDIKQYGVEDYLCDEKRNFFRMGRKASGSQKCLFSRPRHNGPRLRTGMELGKEGARPARVAKPRKRNGFAAERLWGQSSI